MTVVFSFQLGAAAQPKAKNATRDENSESEEEGAEDESDFTSQIDHLDLGFVIAKLDRMTHLGVQYRVKNVGLEFEWSQFQFTGRDCISFSKAIKAHTFITVLELVE